MMDVKNWIQSGQPYSAGVLLYQSLGGRSNLKKFVAQMGRSTVHPQIRNELRTRLLALAPKNPKVINLPKETTAPIKAQPFTISAPSSRTPEVREPSQIEHLRAKARTNLKRRDDAFSRMKAATNDLERYKCAEEIITVWEPAISEAYGEIRRWEDTGEIPSIGKERDIKREVLDKYKKRESNKANIRHIRGKRIPRAKDPEEIKTLQAQIEALIRENEEITEYLK